MDILPKSLNHKKVGSQVMRLTLKIIILAGIAWLVCSYMIGFYRMPSNAMFPGVRDGDLCIYYRRQSLSVSDVVVYRDPDGQLRAGRVAGIPGQVIDFPEGFKGYTVNDYSQFEDIPYETILPETSKELFPMELGTNEYFILNDYRVNANDSRTYGAVKEDAICGKSYSCSGHGGSDEGHKKSGASGQ